MVSRVEIANMALSTYIGARRINSLEEEGVNATALNLHFDATRREILATWPWSFARKRERLALMATNDRDEWAHKYAMPEAVLNVRWINDPQEAKDAASTLEIQDTAREVAGQFIYSDVPDAVMEYVTDLDDPNAYSPHFVQAFAALLASKVAMHITENAAKASNALDAYVTYLDQAKVADLKIQAPVRVQSVSNWLGVR